MNDPISFLRAHWPDCCRRHLIHLDEMVGEPPPSYRSIRLAKQQEMQRQREALRRPDPTVRAMFRHFQSGFY